MTKLTEEMKKPGVWYTRFAYNGWMDNICSMCGSVWNEDVHVILGYKFCPMCGDPKTKYEGTDFFDEDEEKYFKSTEEFYIKQNEKHQRWIREWHEYVKEQSIRRRRKKDVLKRVRSKD